MATKVRKKNETAITFSENFSVFYILPVKMHKFSIFIQNSILVYRTGHFSSQLNVFILCLCIQALAYTSIRVHFLFRTIFILIFPLIFILILPSIIPCSVFSNQLFSFFFGIVHRYPSENSGVEKYIKCKLYYYIIYILYIS